MAGGPTCENFEFQVDLISENTGVISNPAYEGKHAGGLPVLPLRTSGPRLPDRVNIFFVEESKKHPIFLFDIFRFSGYKIRRTRILFTK